LDDPVAAAEELLAQGQSARAVELLSARIAEGRGGLLMRLTLGRALLAAGRADEALASLRDTASLAPGLAEAAAALGEALLETGHLPTAIAELQRSLRLDPGFSRARFLLGNAWLEAGEPEKALQIFSELDGADALAESLARKRRQAEALLAAPRSPSGYVRHLFDQFSADYDSRMLGALSYRAPEILRSLAAFVMGGRDSGLRILDLGCGTGLSGLAFAAFAANGRLFGVDLSPRMIAAASARGCYDGLETADIEEFLARPGPSYDLLLAADTLVYLGDLGPLFASAHGRLEPDGFFLFTVERGEEGYGLGPKRRYRHSEAYLRDVAAKSAFEVAGLLDCAPRSEGGAPVAGLAVALRRP
jgi:predicted TPR repeat methyltransferase